MPDTPITPTKLRELAEYPRDYPEDTKALRKAANEIERLHTLIRRKLGIPAEIPHHKIHQLNQRHINSDAEFRAAVLKLAKTEPNHE